MEFKLTKNQQLIFNEATKTNNNLLILGKPGVGKSVLIRALQEWAESDNGYKYFNLSAPTGLAALNIGGRTMHSLFRLPASKGIIHPD